MGDAQTVISLVVAGILGGIGLWWSRRQMRVAGVGAPIETIARNLRAVADGWEARYDLEHDALVSAQKALADLKAEQVSDGRAWAQCRRDLDDALSQVRDLERRRRPRPTA